MIKQNKIIKQLIKINNKVIAVFYYKQNDNSVGSYIKEFKKNYIRLIKFFDKQPSKITINFIYTRKEMDKLWSEKSPKWLCGTVDPKNIYKIYVFSPLVFEKMTTHKKHEILPTLIHETAHTFVSQINKRCFAWMNEGVCQYVEGDDITKRKIKKKDWDWFIKNNAFFDPDLSWREQAKQDGYKISYNLVKYILKVKDKNKFIQLLKIRRKGDFKMLKQKMNKIVGNIDLLLDRFSKNNI